MKAFALILVAALLTINTAFSAEDEWIFPREDDPFSMPINGYGEFKFGMTLQEAKKIDPRVQIVPNHLWGLSGDEQEEAAKRREKNDPDGPSCGYNNKIKACGIFYGQVADEEVEVVLQAKDGEHVSAVFLVFDRFESPAGSEIITSLWKKITKGLMDKYGLPTKYKRTKLIWNSDSGGQIELFVFLFDADVGYMRINYKPTLGL